MLHRWRTLLGLQPKNYPDLLARAKAMFNGLSGNPALFATPNPPLATIQNRIQALEQAQLTAATRVKGAAAVRNVKAAELITSLETLRAYVQELVDTSPEQGASIIEAAGMVVGQVPAHSKPLLQAKQSKPSSAVQVIANVGLLTAKTEGRVFFNWQSSADGGTTWSTAPPTLYGRIDFTGLTPMETYGFRVSVTDTKGPGEWTPTVTLMVR